MTAHPRAGTDEEIGKELTPFETQVLNLIDTDQVVTLLQALIRSPSDYPPGDTRAAIQLVANQLTLANVDFEILARTEHQPSLLATIGGSSGQKGLLFHSHIDTVSAGDPARWSVDPFAGKIRQGCIYGRGAGDDKGSVAAQVMALMALMRAGVSSDRCVRLVVVADEESGALNGTQWLWLQGKLQAEALVIGEQTENRVAIAERVACGIDLTIFGTVPMGQCRGQGKMLS